MSLNSYLQWNHWWWARLSNSLVRAFMIDYRTIFSRFFTVYQMSFISVALNYATRESAFVQVLLLESKGKASVKNTIYELDCSWKVFMWKMVMMMIDKKGTLRKINESSSFEMLFVANDAITLNTKMKNYMK